MSPPKYIGIIHGPRPRYPGGNNWNERERALNAYRMDRAIQREYWRNRLNILPTELRQRIRGFYRSDHTRPYLDQHDPAHYNWRRWRARNEYEGHLREDLPGYRPFYGPGF